MVGTGVAVGNAIFHATGIRLTTLPFRIDRLLGAAPLSFLSRRRLERIMSTGCCMLEHPIKAMRCKPVMVRRNARSL